MIWFEWWLLSKYCRFLSSIERIIWSMSRSLSCCWSISVLLDFHYVQIFTVTFKYFDASHFFIIYFIQPLFTIFLTFFIRDFSNICLILVFIFLKLLVSTIKRNWADFCIWVKMTWFLWVKMIFVSLMI